MRSVDLFVSSYSSSSFLDPIANAVQWKQTFTAKINSTFLTSNDPWKQMLTTSYPRHLFVCLYICIQIAFASHSFLFACVANRSIEERKKLLVTKKKLMFSFFSSSNGSMISLVSHSACISKNSVIMWSLFSGERLTCMLVDDERKCNEREEGWSPCQQMRRLRDGEKKEKGMRTGAFLFSSLLSFCSFIYF